MEEKKKTGISLATVICIFIIIVMACAIVYLCVVLANTEAEDTKKIVTLNNDLKTVQENNEKLVGTVENLQEKIDKVNETINDGDKKDTKTQEPSATQKDDEKNNKESDVITDDEKTEIENFIKDKENYSFVFIKYNSPKELLKDTKKTDTLRYSICETQYAKIITSDTGISVPDVGSSYYIEIKDLQKVLKDKMNYDYSEDEVKKGFEYDYKNEYNKVVFIISDTIFGEKFDITEIEKVDGKYVVTANVYNGKEKVTLTKEDGKYYFYSCEEV